MSNCCHCFRSETDWELHIRRPCSLITRTTGLISPSLEPRCGELEFRKWGLTVLGILGFTPQSTSDPFGGGWGGGIYVNAPRLALGNIWTLNWFSFCGDWSRFVGSVHSSVLACFCLASFLRVCQGYSVLTAVSTCLSALLSSTCKHSGAMTLRPSMSQMQMFPDAASISILSPSFSPVPNPRANAPTWRHHIITKEITQPCCQKRTPLRPLAGENLRRSGCLGNQSD